MTKAQVHLKLVAYEEANSDLSPSVCRLLALFCLAANKTVPRVYIEEILGYESAVLYRDISRRWWMVLSYSGLSREWKKFKTVAERHGVPEAWRHLSRGLTTDQRRLVLKRLGARPWRVTKESRRSSGREVTGTGNRWFKAGTWYTRGVWTHILVEGKSLDSRRDYTLLWHHKIRRHVRLLERECFHMINPDTITPPAAKNKIVAHVRQRLGELLGRKRVSTEAVAWFLTVDISVSEKLWVAPKMRPGWTRTRTRRDSNARGKMRRWR